MKFSKRDLDFMENVRREVDDWEESKTIPKELKGRKLQDWKDNTYLWEDGENIFISSGGNMFYWILAVLHKNDKQDFLKDIVKHRHWQQLREYLKIEKREKLLGITFKYEDTANGFKKYETNKLTMEAING